MTTQPQEQRRQRQLIVTDLKHIKSGHRNGEPYTLWQVRATGLDGIPIEQNLRTFEELPRDVPITVEVDWFKSQRGYGDSFTLKQVEGSGATATVAPPSPPPPVTRVDEQAVKDLQERVKLLEEQVAQLMQNKTPVQRNGGGGHAAAEW